MHFLTCPRRGIVALRILTIPYRDCKENIFDTVDLIDSLGLTIHPVKSIIIPTQEIQYMSFILNSREMTVQLTREKALTIKKLCQNILLLEYISIRYFFELMGNMVASEYGIPYTKFLHKRLHIS